MASKRLLPLTLRARLALAGALTLFSIIASTLYIRGFSSLEMQREDRGRPPPLKLPADGTVPPVVETHKVLLVSSFFQVPNPQYTDADYDRWLPYFLGENTNDIYLYTTPELEARLRPLRRSNMTITFDTTYASPLEIPPLKGKDEMYRRILRKDRAKSRRSIELYANRHSKPFFLFDAVTRLEKLGQKYEYAFWTDAGSFRSKHVYRNWPSLNRLREVWKEGSRTSGIPEEDMVFIPMSRPPHKSMLFWSEGMGPIDNDISIASFFGGIPKALEWWTRAYYAYHDQYLRLEIFIGKNQAMINSLFFLFPERFITVWYGDPDAPAHLALTSNGTSSTSSQEQSYLGQCGPSERTYYQFWFADDHERKEMKDVWIADASSWRLWGWWNAMDTRPCQTTRVVSVMDVLKRAMGDGWRAPGRQVKLPETIGWVH